MTDLEQAALANIRGLACAWCIRYGRHAIERMDERGATRQDVQAALAGATECRAQPQGRWKITGADRDGDELTVVVVIEDGVVVVTVF
ncbi:MAG: DUF4258 domain-containing protein [Deltaproteobacteria bacterium]|nr:DUF4258 domain-containing protein [Deltaproteobacteria bacterium]